MIEREVLGFITSCKFDVLIFGVAYHILACPRKSQLWNFTHTHTRTHVRTHARQHWHFHVVQHHTIRRGKKKKQQQKKSHTKHWQWHHNYNVVKARTVPRAQGGTNSSLHRLTWFWFFINARPRTSLVIPSPIEAPKSMMERKGPTLTWLTDSVKTI